MNFILFDSLTIRENLLPLTYFRPVSQIRCGIFTLKEKWETSLNTHFTELTETYLQKKFPVVYQEDNVYINAAVFPDDDLINAINSLKPNEQLLSGSHVVALRTGRLSWKELQNFEGRRIEYVKPVEMLRHTYDIFSKNGWQIKKDFVLATRNKISQQMSETNIHIGSHPVFVAKGVSAEAVVFNTEDGPVYLGENVKILEGSLIRGPFAALDGTVIKMGAKIYGGTTLGPNTKAGGEIKDTVFFGNANKGHDGYLGDSVIGEWCNLGAGTNNSNLKNNYSKVKLWQYPQRDYVNTGLQFCGLIMGDHSKSGIATMFNTGTVVGVSSNVFGAGYQPKFFPSFKWGGQSYTDYRFDKAIEVAEVMMQRRHKKFDAIEKEIFNKVYKLVKEKEI